MALTPAANPRQPWVQGVVEGVMTACACVHIYSGRCVMYVNECNGRVIRIASSCPLSSLTSGLHVWAMQAVHAVVIATCISVVVMTGYYIYTDEQTRTNEVSDNHHHQLTHTHSSLTVLISTHSLFANSCIMLVIARLYLCYISVVAYSLTKHTSAMDRRERLSSQLEQQSIKARQRNLSECRRHASTRIRARRCCEGGREGGREGSYSRGQCG